MRGSSSHARCHPALLPLVAALLAGSPWGTEGEPSRLARYKAVFIYNFIEFVEWPEGRDTGPVRIGVVGESDALPSLRAIAGSRKAGTRDIVVEQMLWPAAGETPDCHILFVAASQADSVRQSLGRPRWGGVLTVGEADGLAEEGVIINFVPVQGKLRFQINPASAQDAGLRLSSHLLKLAILVGK